MSMSGTSDSQVGEGNGDTPKLHGKLYQRLTQGRMHALRVARLCVCNSTFGCFSVSQIVLGQLEEQERALP